MAPFTVCLNGMSYPIPTRIGEWVGMTKRTCITTTLALAIAFGVWSVDTGSSLLFIVLQFVGSTMAVIWIASTFGALLWLIAQLQCAERILDYKVFVVVGALIGISVLSWVQVIRPELAQL